MRIALAALTFILVALPASAQSCYEWGNQTSCDNGVTINRYGNQNVITGNSILGNGSGVPTHNRYDPGSRSSGNGNIAGARSDLTYRVRGNRVFFSDGTTATIQGNMITFSDGRTCRQSGTSRVCN